MRVNIVHSSEIDIRKCYAEIKNKLESLDFEPNVVMLFLTESTWMFWKAFNELLKKKFPNAQMMGIVIEGYVLSRTIHTRGVCALLMDYDGDVRVFYEKGKGATKTVEKLGNKIGKGWDLVILAFPAAYFPGKIRLGITFFNDRIMYGKFQKADYEEKIRIMEKYSKYLDRANSVFPVNRTLRIVAERTGYDTPIVGLNLLPLQAATSTPFILANYRLVSPGAAALCFKGKINAYYSDIFPERGKSFEETIEIVKSRLANVEDVKVTKKGLVIGEINGMKPVDFLLEKVRGYEQLSEDEFKQLLDKGELQTFTPYGIGFVSRETYGFTALGLLPYPINFHPCIFELDYFYEDGVFFGEHYKGGVRQLVRVFEGVKEDAEFHFFVIDSQSIFSFGRGLFQIFDVIKLYSENYFGILLQSPPIYTPKPANFMTEIEKGIHYFAAGNTVLIEFMQK